jgi:FMN phosphatase YigB (HAD superfamily)
MGIDLKAYNSIDMTRKYIFDLDDTLYPPVKMQSPWLQSSMLSTGWGVSPGFYEHIQPDPELNELIRRLGNTYIFTNASKGHMITCLQRMNAMHCFKRVIYNDLYKGTYKPMFFPYLLANHVFELSGDVVYFFEDSLPNLKTAKQLGWNTIFIDHVGAMNASNKPPFVDAVFADIKSAVRAVSNI